MKIIFLILKKMHIEDVKWAVMRERETLLILGENLLERTTSFSP